MEHNPRAHVVRLHGDLGLVDQKDVESQLPSPESVDRLVLDCSEVTSMDSTIIVAIMNYRRRFIIAGKSAFDIVAIVSPRIEKLFELTGVSRSITVLPMTRKPSG